MLNRHMIICAFFQENSIHDQMDHVFQKDNHSKLESHRQKDQQKATDTGSTHHGSDGIICKYKDLPRAYSIDQ